MKIRDIMTEDVEIASPNDTVASAAQRMAEYGCGVLPVGENDRLVGMITDRDIVTRAIAKGADPQTCRVKEVMSAGVKYCYDDESDDDLARAMKELQIKRLPVLNRDKRLVGIVSLCDLALIANAARISEAVSGISRPA